MANYTVVMTGTGEVAPEVLAGLGASFTVAARQNLADQITRRQLASDRNQRTFSFSKILELSDALPTALNEYEDPASVPLAGASTTFTAQEHGLVVTKTELADIISGGALGREAAVKVGNSAARFLDRQVADALGAGTNAMFAGAGTEAGLVATDVMTPALLNRAYNALSKSGATKDAQGYFRAILHPDQILDLKNQVGSNSWTDVMKYADPGALLRGEVGAMSGFRIIESTAFAPVDAAGAGTVDVYQAVFFGADALGQGINVGPELRITSSDKLARFVNIGWYYCGVMGIIAQEQVFRIATASSIGVNA